MNKYEVNKQMLIALGGNPDDCANEFEVKKAILNLLGGDSTNCSDIYEVDLEILKIYEEGGGGSTGGGGGKVKVKSIKFNNNCVDEDGKIYTDNIDTSLVTSMYNMFYNCGSLTELDLSDLSVGNVTDMSYVFSNCKMLQSVGDLSNWNVGNVTNMRSMFNGCNSLQSVGDLSNWDVSKVTDMYNIFNGCNSLQSVGDLSNWNVGNVTNMLQTFIYCYSLQNLNLSNWNVSKVTTMQQMFRSCYSLQNLNLSNWDTSSLTNLKQMFYETSIDNLDITGWTDVSNVTSADNFYATYNSQSAIKTFVGGRSVDDVINNNIKILNGLKVDISIRTSKTDRASIRALINGVADLSGTTTKYINLGDLSSKLTDEDIAIATAKNWTIS